MSGHNSFYMEMKKTKMWGRGEISQTQNLISTAQKMYYLLK